jgi:hypothetical protein
MLGKMSAIAAECIRRPGYTSVWSKAAGKYVCSRDVEFQAAVREELADRAAHPPISSAFKLVFLTAAAGTLIFVLICVGLHAWLGEKMPAATVKLVDGLIGMAQIGFGAVVGLLGGQVLRPEPGART